MSEVNKKKRINFVIGEWILDELDYMAVQRGMSRSAFISMLVSNEFNRLTKEGTINTVDVFRKDKEQSGLGGSIAYE